MMNNITCLRCGATKPDVEFAPSRSPFQPNHRSVICLSCLEKMVPADDLTKVDALCRWLDIPFVPKEWTRIWDKAKERTLRVYLKVLDETAGYEGLDWKTLNDKWKTAQAHGTLEDEIPALNESWLRDMAARWPSEQPRGAEDYRYLEELYADLCATQNLVSATQRDDAKRLCEIGLQINKTLRAGGDASKLMTMYHNIIKAEGFEPKNAKSLSDFDSTGELFAWLEKRGWKPDWRTEPQDSIDFTINQIQKYLQRLVLNESSLGDQVADRKRQMEIAARIDETEEEVTAEELEAEEETEYEGEEDLAADLEDDQPLN